MESLQQAQRPERTAKTRATKAAAAERFAIQNRIAAEIILGNPTRYAGLPIVWAQLVLEGYKPVQRSWRIAA